MKRNETERNEMIRKFTGDIFVTIFSDASPNTVAEKVLEIEQWLNGKVTEQMYSKFGACVFT